MRSGLWYSSDDRIFRYIHRDNYLWISYGRNANSYFCFEIVHSPFIIALQSNPLHLILFCQGPFRWSWATWPCSLILIYRGTVYQVRSVSYHTRAVECCCMQWSPIAFHSKATHFIWIDLLGSIPAELGNLTALTNLWLQDNKLSGDEGVYLGDCLRNLRF